MASETFAEKVQALKEANTNTIRGSKVKVEAEHAPKLYFRPETGELIAVPVAESNAFNTEIGEWNSLIATLHAANEQVQYFEDHITKLILKPDLTLPGAKEEAERKLEISIEWQEEVFDTCRAKMESLAKIGSSGKKLVELIPISAENSGKKVSKPAEFEDGKYTKESKGSWAKGAKRTPSKDWIRPPAGALVYVTSDKIKSHWPTFKDPEKLKWEEVIAKDENGNRKIDEAKARQYASQLAKKIKLESKDYLKVEKDTEGAIGIWATMWNTDTANKFSRKGSVSVGPAKSTIELDAGAQFMRYLYGGSLNATFEPFKKNVSFRIEGHAEIAIVEAKATAALYFPCKEGWMWSLPAPGHGANGSVKELDLGAVRFMVSLEVKGVVGASIAAEASLGVEAKEGQMPLVKGLKTRKRGKRRAKKVQVIEETGPEEETRVVGLDLGLNVFAGAKADSELKGAIEWRDPEDPDKNFEAFATVAHSAGGLMGIGITAKFMVQYTGGIFKLHVDAGLCIRLGAEGKISFEVSSILFAKFLKWLFYQLYHANFKNLPFIQNSAFLAVKKLAFIAIAEGRDIASNFGILESEINERMKVILGKLALPEGRMQLAQNILSNPEALRYAPSESKGMLIYQLCRDFDMKDWVKKGIEGGGDFLRGQKEAIELILKRWSHTRSDCNNIVQHMSPDGDKGSYDANLTRLRSFFNQDALRDLPSVASVNQEDKEFDHWYDQLMASLKDEPTRGFPIVPADSFEYAMQRDDNCDHPLFSAIGDRALYA